MLHAAYGPLHGYSVLFRLIKNETQIAMIVLEASYANEGKDR